VVWESLLSAALAQFTVNVSKLSCADFEFFNWRAVLGVKHTICYADSNSIWNSILGWTWLLACVNYKHNCNLDFQLQPQGTLSSSESRQACKLDSALIPSKLDGSLHWRWAIIWRGRYLWLIAAAEFIVEMSTVETIWIGTVHYTWRVTLSSNIRNIGLVNQRTSMTVRLYWCLTIHSISLWQSVMSPSNTLGFCFLLIFVFCSTQYNTPSTHFILSVQ